MVSAAAYGANATVAVARVEILTQNFTASPSKRYPLGRIVGGTVYPGLMLTSGLAWKLLHALNLPIHIREVCVFIIPWMASNTTLAAYFLTKGLCCCPFYDVDVFHVCVSFCACGAELKDSSAGLLAAIFIGIVPGSEIS